MFFHILARNTPIKGEVRVEISTKAVIFGTLTMDKSDWDRFKVVLGSGVGGAALQNIAVNLDDRAS